MAPFIPIQSQLKSLGFNFVAGIDEAGRGPLAGPVVSAAVILKKDANIKGLNDSKLLSPKKREELFEIILKNCIDYAIGIVSHTQIDKVNILNATIAANDLCIRGLKQKPDLVLIDGRDKQIVAVPFQTIIKGDQKVPAIAAASILAKVTRDAIMKYYSKKYPEYGFAKHKGYGTRQHRSNISKFGFCDIHRRSYTFKR